MADAGVARLLRLLQVLDDMMDGREEVFYP
jgi:hypothetical protein